MNSCVLRSAKQNRSFPALLICAFVLTAGYSAYGFPSWMGVYGSFQRHNGENPGTFTVLMNQDYWGLHAEVGMRVNGGSWATYEMSYVGNTSGNSVYQFTPSWEFPATQIVEFYFHGWDNWGGNCWDSNYGQNYWFPAYHNGRVQWIGNTWNWPTNGAITSNDNFWVNIESWPSGAAKEGRIVYTDNRGLSWKSTNLQANGQTGNNDAWHVSLGKFEAAETIRYAVEIVDWTGNHRWDNNGGFDFYSLVNYNSSSDQDGDGMPNGWEIANGFDPTDPTDADDDKDGDELTNVREYLAGSDPANSDTDGDGIEDAIEVLGTLTSPTNAQSHSLQTALSINGASGTNILGQWSVQGNSIIAATNRGAIGFTLAVSATDIYLLEIRGANTPSLDGISRPAALDVYIDDCLVKRVVLAATASNSAARCVTPNLQAGNHALRISWDNERSYNRLQIDKVELKTLNGSDADNDGIKDWVTNWTLSRNGAELLPPSSAVSPAFIEGRSAFPSMTSLSGGLTVKNGAGRRWYGNVPLAANTSTPVTVTFENGALQESGQIVWRPTNVLLDNNISIRKGDSLLMTAHPLGASDGSVMLNVQGQGSYTTTVDDPIPLEFTAPGNYSINGSYNYDGQLISSTITVTVISSAFSDSPAAWVGKLRSWVCSNIASSVLIQPDPSIRMADTGTPSGGGRSFNFVANGSQSPYVVARLGVGGPILDSTPVRAFRSFSSAEVYLKCIQTYSDGSKLIEMGVVQSPVLTDTTAELEIFAGGVTFDDGTLFKQISPSNFNSLGQTAVRFVKAAGVQNSVCHNFKIYQSTSLVGSRQQ